MVEISKSEEGLYFPFIRRASCSCYFYQIHFNLVLQDNQPQVLDPSFLKLAFFGPEVQLVFRQSSEYLVGDLSVFIQVFRKDKNDQNIA